MFGINIVKLISDTRDDAIDGDVVFVAEVSDDLVSACTAYTSAFEINACHGGYRYLIQDQ